jgi:hypothetical protein
VNKSKLFKQGFICSKIKSNWSAGWYLDYLLIDTVSNEEVMYATLEIEALEN